jgi:hypothetical protein
VTLDEGTLDSPTVDRRRSIFKTLITFHFLLKSFDDRGDGQIGVHAQDLALLVVHEHEPVGQDAGEVRYHVADLVSVRAKATLGPNFVLVFFRYVINGILQEDVRDLLGLVEELEAGHDHLKLGLLVGEGVLRYEGFPQVVVSLFLSDLNYRGLQSPANESCLEAEPGLCSLRCRRSFL